MGKKLVECLTQAGASEDMIELASRKEFDDLNIDAFLSEAEKVSANKMRVAKLQAVKSQEVLDVLRNSPSKKESESLVGILVKSGDDATGAVSVDSYSRGVRQLYYAQLDDVLEEFKPDWLGRSTNKGTQLDVVREMSGISTRNGKAKSLGKQLTKAFEDMRVRLNKAGASIRHLEGWMLPQQHNARKIANVSASQWALDTAELLDMSKMDYTSRVDLIKDLEEVGYKKIVTEDSSGSNSIFSSPTVGNTHKRFLHFKDGDAWIAYQDKYGSDDVMGTIMAHVGNMSSDIALAEKFGPKPKDTFNELKKEFLSKNTTGKAKQAVAQSESIFKDMTGELRIADLGLHENFATIKHLTNAGLLHGTPLVATSDLAYGAVTAKFMGMKGFRTAVRMMKNWNPLSKADRRLAARTALANDYQVNQNVMADRYGSISGVGAEWARKASSITANISGLSSMTEGSRAAFNVELSGFMADGLKHGFGNDKTLNLIKEAYGINDKTLKNWKRGIRKEKGANIVDASKIPDTEDAANFVAFVQDAQSYAVPGGGMRSKHTFSAFGRGTWGSELAGLIMQYKSFPVTMWNTHIKRALISQQLSGSGKIGYASLTLASTAGLGMIAVQAREFSKTGEFRDWEDPALVRDGLMVGGSTSFAGDLGGLVFGARGQADSMFSVPAMSAVKRGVKVAKDTREGEFKEAGLGALKTAQGLTPGAWYTDYIINRLLWDGIEQTSDNSHKYR